MDTVMISSSSSSSMALQRLLRPAPATILSFSFLKQPLSLLPYQTTSSLHPITNHSPPSFFLSLRTRTSIFLRSRTLSNLPVSCSSQALLESSEEDVDDEEIAEEIGEETGQRLSEPERKILRAKLPNLTVKEKKELGSYAHSLGKKLKSQQVGKSGITDTVVMALDETLEANELLKLKIHGTCPGGELDDIVKHLEEATGSVVVGQIGRTVILYRPSLTKMKAEEKKKQAQILFMKKRKQYAERRSFQVPHTRGMPPPPVYMYRIKDRYRDHMLVVAEELAGFDLSLWLNSSLPFHSSHSCAPMSELKFHEYSFRQMHTYFQSEDEDRRDTDLAYEISSLVYIRESLHLYLL